MQTMRNMRKLRKSWSAAVVAAGIVVLGGCGSSGTVGVLGPTTGGTGPAGGASPGGGSTTGGPTTAASAVAGSTTGGASGSASGSANPASPANPADPCSLISPADVAKLANLPAASGGAPSTQPSQDSDHHYCLFDNNERDSVQIGIGNVDKQSFDLEKMGDHQDVAGLGEEAIFSSDGILKVYKSGKEVIVWVIHGGFGGGDPNVLAQEKAIAQAVIGKV